MLPWLEQLLTTYGYLAVGLTVMAESMGVPLPGETLLLLGAAYAGAGHLELRGVIFAAAFGAVVGPVFPQGRGEFICMLHPSAPCRASAAGATSLSKNVVKGRSTVPWAGWRSCPRKPKRVVWPT